MALTTVVVLGHRFSSLTAEEQVLAGVAQVVDANTLDNEQLADALHNADAILLGTQAKLDANAIGMLPRCRIIVRYGVGVDNIAVEEARRLGILVANVPEYCVNEVADHTMALLLAASRRLITANTAARTGAWGMRVMKGVMRLSEQVVGIVGFGRIGQAMAQRVHPFVRRIFAFDPNVPAQTMTELGVDATNLSSLLGSSDYVSIHCPLTPNTRHLINAQTLGQMKSTAWLINTSRGQIIDEPALVEALQTRRIGGAALDVLTVEPPVPDSRLLALDNVILTPHVASYSESAMMDLQREAAMQARIALLGGEPKWLISRTHF